MSDTPRLREARTDDAAEIARLAGEWGYPVSAEVAGARLGVLLRDAAQYLVVAEGAQGLLGWIAVERRITLESGRRAEIVGLIVDPAARRQGVGALLLAEAERWVREHGLAELVVRSNVARELSHPFYLGHGYRLRKTQHVYAKALRAN